MQNTWKTDTPRVFLTEGLYPHHEHRDRPGPRAFLLLCRNPAAHRLTNVISTLSANIMMRAREFAVFVSIGMTGRDLRKMLYLEGILCVLKAIIIGIPVSVAATYLINYPIRKMYQSL